MGLRHHLLADLPLPHATIYLNVSPEVCFERIHKLRQRDCESTIPVEYLAGLDECYGRLLRFENQNFFLMSQKLE